jgi:type I restriction enzyme R subunit
VSPKGFDESALEHAALEWMRGLGYAVVNGPSIAPEEPAAEREDYAQVVLVKRLKEALARLNPDLPADAREEALKKLIRIDSPSLIERNHAAHRMMVDGVTVEYRRKDGSIAGAQARVFDFYDPNNNDWLAVNQLTVVENKIERRADIVLYVNGLPLVVIELKNPADEDADVWAAYNQLKTYQAQITSLFTYNAALVASNGQYARMGALDAGREWFKPWRTITGDEEARPEIPELQVMAEGVFNKERLLDMLRFFIVFEDLGGGKLVKKMAGYHQFHAVNMAIEQTLRASSPAKQKRNPWGRKPAGEPGDRRVGVVWHTQGSGKSLTMVFYAGKVVLHPQMENPTIVVLTDRNDLDNQLFGNFARCRDLLRQEPAQADTRKDLRTLLKVGGGGVVFTTIQKFLPEEKGDKYPLLSERTNIVVIADEAHRSQYDFIDGLARHLHDALPNASFIGFTGTPIERVDANTRQVFGDYISIYDIQKAVEDGATVPIYYESRLAKLELSKAEQPRIDKDFEEITEGEEAERKEKLKSQWSRLEALVGAEKRIKLIAGDIVKHFEDRCSVMDGKAMIVCMSRRICVDLFNAIAALRPEWKDDADEKGALKVVMTGSASDPLDWQGHIRNKQRREALALRFRDARDPFKIAIVRDMWLTGFDAPSLHTMYVDKPMRGHGLMQAIARVNRVFSNKPGGLVVDYIGLAEELRGALAAYTESGGTGKTAVDQAEAVAVMLEKYEVCLGLFHGFSWSTWKTADFPARMGLLAAAREHVLSQDDGKERLMQAVTDLSQAFALAIPAEEALRIRDDVGFFQAVKAPLAKGTPEERKSDEEMSFAIRQIVSNAMVSDEVMDVFAMAGLRKPDISILSDQFLSEVRGLPHKNLAVELLQRLLAGEIKTRFRRNVVAARSFMEMLENALKKYKARAIETAQVIEELIGLAKEMNQARGRGEALGLSEDEVAFYDALETNDSAVKVLGEPTLKKIARELVSSVKKSVKIDWTQRESVRAQIRVQIKRILRKYGYPPDKQEKATETVLEQAAVLCPEWAAA